jgi:hypothetical protein
MGTNTTQTPPPDPVEYQGWLDAIVPLAEGARLRGDVHVDTLKREDKRRRDSNKPPILVRRSKRLLGIRRRHALMIDWA